MGIIWLAALGATLVAGVTTGLLLLLARGDRPSWRLVAPWAAQLWLLNFLFDCILLYGGLPALTGPYGGWQWLLWPLLLTGGYVLFGGSLGVVRATLDTFTEQINSGASGLGATTFRSVLANGGDGRGATRRRSGAPWVVSDHPPQQRRLNGTGRAGLAALVLALVIALVANGLISVATTWFDPNVKALAHIPHIVSEPESAQLPPTDVNHIVLVTQGVAAYLGQQTLGAYGQNLGSVYHTERKEYTLQSVKGHLYWAAPLVYNNVWANLGRWESPGYVLVDAEDPNAAPQLRIGFHLRYLPDAVFNQELLRHVYLSGYTTGNLVDPTLEIDDNYQPYFTLSLMRPTRGFIGDVVDRVLVVDPQSGAITSYAPGATPKWVDRIIPAQTVTDYLTWWGKYSKAGWLNLSGANQQVPAANANSDANTPADQTDAPQLLYNTADQPVWLAPMTSSSASDSSSTGVVLFDTRDNTGHFYPINGIGVGNNVRTVFQSNPRNIRGYDVGVVQLYQIYGEPTWVASFVQSNDTGQSFQAVGLVDARRLNGANVIMDASKSQALTDYAQWLADHNPQGQSSQATSNAPHATTQGKVERISATTENNSTVYYILLQGQTRIYKAGLQISPELPLVQPGDTIQGTYLDTGQTVVTFTSFSDLDLHLNQPVTASTPGAIVVTPTPSPSPTPTASPTATPSASP